MLSTTNVPDKPSHLGDARILSWAPTSAQLLALTGAANQATVTLFIGGEINVVPFEAINQDMNIRLGPGTALGIVSEEFSMVEIGTMWCWHEEPV